MRNQHGARERDAHSTPERGSPNARQWSIETLRTSRRTRHSRVQPLDDTPARPHTMSSFFGLSKTRTFKPKRNIPEGTKQ